MGIELDVLTGHPEHDLLFVATQVARAAGLKDPATSVSDYRKLTIHREMPGQSLSALIGNLPVSVPVDARGKKYRTTTIMFPESEVHQMLLRGHAPASEPFRKWVTEEVLPTIRKTGKYNAEESTNPIVQSVMDELKTLRGDIAERDQRYSQELGELKALNIEGKVFCLSDALFDVFVARHCPVPLTISNTPNQLERRCIQTLNRRQDYGYEHRNAPHYRPSKNLRD